MSVPERLKTGVKGCFVFVLGVRLFYVCEGPLRLSLRQFSLHTRARFTVVVDREDTDKQRQDREETRDLKIVPEVALSSFDVVSTVCGFGRESPWGFVSFWLELCQLQMDPSNKGDSGLRRTATDVDSAEKDGDEPGLSGLLVVDRV